MKGRWMRERNDFGCPCAQPSRTLHPGRRPQHCGMPSAVIHQAPRPAYHSPSDHEQGWTELRCGKAVCNLATLTEEMASVASICAIRRRRSLTPLASIITAERHELAKQAGAVTTAAKATCGGLRIAHDSIIVLRRQKHADETQ